MNREVSISMAREVGFDDFEQDDMLERFAALVADATLEACAQLADEHAPYWAGYKIAEAIRARKSYTD